MDFFSLDMNASPFLHYRLVAVLLLFRFGYIFFVRKHSKLIEKRISRPSSDATWFLPVYVWGIEFLLYIKWLYDMGPGSGSFISLAFYFEQFLFSAVILAIVIGLCFLQEFLARHVGMGVRESQITIPLPLLVGILSVWLIWVIFYTYLPRIPSF
jgi:hypothetical protein